VDTWLRNAPPTHRNTALIGLTVAAVLVVALTAFAFPAANPVAGCLAGVTLFFVARNLWPALPEDLRARTDLKTRMDLNDRRTAMGVVLVVWLVMVLLTGSQFPEPAVGTLNVLVIVAIFWTCLPTPDERALVAEKNAKDEERTNETIDRGTAGE
jgi:hypothetical protein